MQLGIGEHLTVVRRHWIKVLLVIAGAVLVTGAIAFLSSKVYVSEARILILNSSPAERASRPTQDQLGVVSSPQEQVLTQVAIIKSPLLAERLALELGPERVLDEMAWRWDWLRDLPGRAKDRVIAALFEWEITAGMMARSGLLRPGAGDEGGAPVGAARDKILDAMHAEAIVKTDMFAVAYAAPSPEFAAEALSGLMDIYVAHVVSLRRPVDTAAIAQQEADRLAERLADAENALRSFAVEHDILSIERQKDLLLDRRARLEEDLATARRTALETDQKLEALTQSAADLPRSEPISVTTRPNPVIDRLRERMADLQTDRQRFVAGSAAAAQIEREIASLSSQIEVQSRDVTGAETTGASSLYQQLTNTATLESAELEALAVRSGFLERELAELTDELRTLDGHELRYRQLQRAVEAREEAYRYAQQKREETAIQAQISEPSLAQVVPVEPAGVPDLAASPRRGRLLALGLVAGLLAGIGMAYLLEFSRRTIATPQEAELALGLPVLAVTERQGLLNRRLRRTRHEMRRVAVGLQHLREVNGPGRFALLLSSLHRRSGTSALAAEMARALHLQGVNVLVLRLEPGTDGAEPEPPPLPAPKAEDGAIQKAQNVALALRAPAGQMARRVRQILTSRAEADEVILIDAPDLCSFPEQIALAGMVDAVLPVIEAGRTRLPDIFEQIRDLHGIGARVPGMALTKRRQARSSWAFAWMAVTRRKAMERAAG